VTAGGSRGRGGGVERGRTCVRARARGEAAGGENPRNDPRPKKPRRDAAPVQSTKTSLQRSIETTVCSRVNSPVPRDRPAATRAKRKDREHRARAPRAPLPRARRRVARSRRPRPPLPRVVARIAHAPHARELRRPRVSSRARPEQVRARGWEGRVFDRSRSNERTNDLSNDRSRDRSRRRRRGARRRRKPSPPLRSLTRS